MKHYSMRTLWLAGFVCFFVLATINYFRVDWGEYREWKDGKWQNKHFSVLEIVVDCAINATVQIFLIAAMLLILRTVGKSIIRNRAQSSRKKSNPNEAVNNSG